MPYVVRLVSVRRNGGALVELDEQRDLCLAEQIAGGDEDAFAHLFERYGPMAFGLAIRLLGDRGLAEEVVQEVFLNVWRKASTFDRSRGSLHSWLLSQVHHRAVDAVRREESQRRRTTSTFPDVVAEPDYEDVIEAEWLAVRRKEVRRALASLPAEQRTVIELSYYGGLTQAEVSTRLQVPLGTVKSRTSAGMKRLRSMLHGDDER